MFHLPEYHFPCTRGSHQFQEYFTAFYIFSLEDQDLYEASQLFEKGHNRIGDAAFSMFYEMYPDKIKKYVFLPLLRDLIEECEAGDGSSTIPCY